MAIVGIPAALNPGGAYPRILARFTEVSLGIACMALVSRLIFPAGLAPKLVALVHELMRRADRFAETAMDPRQIGSSSLPNVTSSPRTSQRWRPCGPPRFSRAPTPVS